MAAAAMDSIGGATGAKPDATRMFPAAPADKFWASGHNNNMCFVVPGWDVVIVRLGVDGNVKDEIWNVFLQTFREALDADGSDSREVKLSTSRSEESQ